MEFWIQTGCPGLNEVEDVADDMADAIACLYPTETDFLILSWNRVPIPLVYSEDVYVIVDDVVVLLEEIQQPDFTATRVSWGSSSFHGRWRVARNGDALVVDSHWESTHGNYEALLNERGRITVPTALFTAEWLKLLRQLVDDIDRKSVRLADADTLRRARALLKRDAPSADILFTNLPDDAAAPPLWRAGDGVAQLFRWQAQAVAKHLGIRSGLGDVRDGECTVDPDEFTVFCASAIGRYGASDEGVERALTVAFIATALVLLDRTGAPVPSAGTPEQDAAWTALREQHAALMPR